MKPEIKDLQDSLWIGYNAFKNSRLEAQKVYKYFHNEQYTQVQLHKIRQRGAPAETYNFIKLFSRLLVGYYSSVINHIQVTPRKSSDVITASVLNDLVDYTLGRNNFSTEADKMKLDMMLSGMMCCFESVEPTGKFDEFGRPLYEVKISHVPTMELILDPMSKKSDYSDAKFIHRYKWVSEEDLKNTFSGEAVDKLTANVNSTNIPQADVNFSFPDGLMVGKYRVHNMYLVVHSIIKDKTKSWSVFWSGDYVLDKQEITYRSVKNPYRLQKLYETPTPMFYGIFREIMETQDAVNQALLKIQTMVNTQKALVERDKVENLADFETAFNRVNAVIPVKSIAGVQIINLTREVQDQYTIIDNAKMRVKEILGINDSFLGLAYANDSGKKVQIQQNASVVALKYLSTAIENFYRLLGHDMVDLIKQYYIAHDVIAVADTYTSQRWVEINAPFIAVDAKGRQKLLLEEVIDPNTGKPMTDNDGNIVMSPIPTAESEIAFTEADIRVESVAYNNEQEQSEALLNNFLNSNLGTFLMQSNPAGFARAGALALKNMKNKFSPELADILTQTAQIFEQQQMISQALQQSQGAEIAGAEPREPMMGV